MELRAGYKKTEVGVIPDDWETKKLGDCLIKNPDYGINAAAVGYDDTLPTYLRITDISESGKYLSVNKVSIDNLYATSYYLENGDIVFARTGASVGKTYLYDINDGQLVFAGFLIRVKANPEILSPNYLIYLTQTKSYWSWVSANSMRSGQPGLNSREFMSLSIPLPPTLTEQTAIANALSDADALITSLENLIAKKRNIKQGAMQKLLQPKEGWDVKRLGEVVGRVTTGKLDANAMKENGQFRFYTCAKDYYFIDQYAFDTEALLISGNGANVGYIHYYKGKFNAYQRTYVLFDFGINVFYIKLFLDNYLEDRITTEVSAGNTPYIKMDTLTNMTISYPNNTREQTRIASILSDMDNEITALENKLEKYKKIKLGMMQNLLTGRIRLI
ncbi:MAG: restriction endonuclease subunit S [Desulfamplus sp.]|nr:restriction endonuclease subunit S [Desulfamplus sp.]